MSARIPAVLGLALLALGCGPSYDATLVPVATLAGTRGTVNVPKVARRGDTLYLADDNLGLTLWDISRPEAPVRLERLPLDYDNIRKLELEGDHLHVLAERGPAALDVRAPRSPRVVFEGGGASDVAVVGDHLYMAASGRVSYTRLGPGASWLELTPPGSLAALARVGDRVLLAVGRAYEDAQTANMIVLDVARPDLPRVLYAGRVDGQLDDVAVFGDTAYIAAPDEGILVFDMSTPSAPREIDRLSGMTPFHAYVDAESRQLLVQSNNRAVYVLDITEPRAPRPRAMFETSAAGIAAAPSGHVVVGHFGGVEVMRLAPR